MAVVEYARHVCGFEGAGSTEFDPDSAHPVIAILPEQKQIEGLGGNMRLGGKDVLVQGDTLAAALYGGSGQVAKWPSGQVEVPETHTGESGSKPDASEMRPLSSSATGPLDHSTTSLTIRERFRHRYEVDPRYIEALEANGLVFSGRHPEQPIMQVLELPPSQHPYFIGAQFHPELSSRPLKPAPLFMGLLAAGIHRAYPEAASDPLIAPWLTRAEGAAPTAP
jgi:CTP synthase